MTQVSDRLASLSPSATLAMSQKSGELKAQGIDVINLSVGEPDFNTPDFIKEAAKKAIDDNFSRYSPVAGYPALRNAIVAKLKNENGLEYTAGQISCANGAKQSVCNTVMVLVNPGDEVIIPAPYWVTYPELARLNGGIVVEPKTDESTGFKLTADELKKLITPRTKMLVLTSPSNPTGSVYTKEELAAIADVLKGTKVVVAADEMYEKLVYDGKKFTSAAAISEDMYQRTVTINGLSKSVAMTGWRFGYLASPNKELIKAMNNLQSQSTSNINSITQKASIVALKGDVDGEIEAMRVEFEKRRNIGVEGFNAIEGLSVLAPDGAFYLFVNISKIEKDSMKFCKELLEKEGVAVVPGVGFGVEGYFRFSFATDSDTIKKGVERIAKFVKNNY